MKNEVLFLLLDGFADWEGAFLSTVLNTGLSHTSYEPTGLTPKMVSLSGEFVRSLGGMTVATDYTARTIPDDFAALILVGGTGWQSDEARQVVPMVETALAKGALVGGICNASLFLGAHGFLNDIRHTGNTLPMMKQWGGDRYTGEMLYQERQAVRDGNMVTANGTACLEFTRECLSALGVGTQEQIDAYFRFNKQGLYN